MLNAVATKGFRVIGSPRLGTNALCGSPVQRTSPCDGLCFAWYVGRRRLLLVGLSRINFVSRQRVRNDVIGTVEGIGIARREVKFYDPRKTS